MADDPRPLSPHLQIWRWEISMLLSILHRASGVALSLGTLFLVLWLVALAADAALFEQVQLLLASPPGIAGLVVYSLALYYHLCNGIRHLFWDMGYGFELEVARRSAWAVLAVSSVLTLATWVLAAGSGA